jgi:kanamycin kinase
MAPVPTPPAIAIELAAGRPITLVWQNEVDGLTFEVGRGRDRCFVKWTPASSGVDLERERVRLDWVGRFAVVPAVIDHGRDSNGSWLVTRALRGTNAVADRWKADPATAVAAIGLGLRRLHDGVPVAECPFEWSHRQRIAEIRTRAARGAIDPERWNVDHRELDLERALAVLEHAPEIDRLVVCHGDACAPNTLIDDDGQFCGHVDVGALGVADRWADLAIATWSTGWNYGPGWEAALLEAYGVTHDEARTRFYRLLQDLGP